MRTGWLPSRKQNEAEGIGARISRPRFRVGYALPAEGGHAGKRGYHAFPVAPHIAIAYALKRLRNGHTQTEIARKLGISYQAYQKLENPRKCNPTLKTLERVGEVMGKRLSLTWT